MSQPTFTAAGPGYPAEIQPGDALVGGKAIWEYRNALLGTDTSLSATFKQLANGDIPAKKTPSGYIASKRALRQHYAAGTGLSDPNPRITGNDLSRVERS
jgi:hypothetical protein